MSWDKHEVKFTMFGGWQNKYETNMNTARELNDQVNKHSLLYKPRCDIWWLLKIAQTSWGPENNGGQPNHTLTR